MMNVENIGTSSTYREPSTLLVKSRSSNPTIEMASSSKNGISKTKPDTKPTEFGSSYVAEYPCTEMGAIMEPSSYSIDSYQLGPLAPFTPSISEIDNRTGLTVFERKEIITSLLTMKRTLICKTESEEKEFSNAQRKLKSLLLATQSRLTEQEREGFINEAKRFEEMKNYMDLETLIKPFNEAKKGINQDIRKDIDCCFYFFLILLKAIQLNIGILLYIENKQLVEDDQVSAHLLVLLWLIKAIFTSCSLMLYSFGYRSSRSMLLYEIAYHLLCAYPYAIACYFKATEIMRIKVLCFGMIITCTLDLVQIECLWAFKSHNQVEGNYIIRQQETDFRYLTQDRNCSDLNQHYGTSYDSVSRNAFPSRNVMIIPNQLNNGILANLSYLNENHQQENIYHQNHNHE